MWTRTEVKSYAKSFLKTNYWKTFFVLLIVVIAFNGFNQSGSSNGLSGITQNFQYITTMEGDAPISAEPYFVLFKSFFSQFKPLAFLGFGVITFTTIVLSLIGLFISFLLEVGKSKYFLEAFKSEANVKNLFFAFNSKDFINIIRVQGIVSMKLILWFFVLIIPGFIKLYEYRYVSYVLAEDPSLSSREAIKRSKEMTDGEKANLFVLDVSFILYHLLGFITFGISDYFVNPYLEATDAKVYTILSQAKNINFMEKDDE